MNKLFIRHYVPSPDSGAKCVPCAETSENLSRAVDRMSPKLEGLNIEPVIQTMEIPVVTENNGGKLNYLSFIGPEVGVPEEAAIEDILGASVSLEEWEGCLLPEGVPFKGRTLSFEGKKYQGLPSEILTDALVRIVFSALSGCSPDGCEACEGCERF